MAIYNLVGCGVGCSHPTVTERLYCYFKEWFQVDWITDFRRVMLHLLLLWVDYSLQAWLGIIAEFPTRPECTESCYFHRQLNSLSIVEWALELPSISADVIKLVKRHYGRCFGANSSSNGRSIQFRLFFQSRGVCRSWWIYIFFYE